ncbi:class I SAM-dependent methyltransferase [Tautonia sociabilis]|uniref:Methyltransferase domain-containing protein n=1 Tax=Tautonia sociabilis TaxID=2080755 RepID=A0A432MH38_9BACT|nr:methyltransferase domain-containing protein [Tautonia sociabilis]RUL86299.1 methyltransferase domain-containing protein [Tautonia sociabilis]
MSEAVRLEYDRLAPRYERRWSRYVRRSIRAATEWLHPEGTERLLDLASGTGALPAELLGRWPGLRIVGVDLSVGMLREASRKQMAPGRLRLVQADSRRLPLGSGRFDLATCVSGLHCFRDPEAGLLELARVLRPGGRLVLVDWCDDYLACRLCSAWLRLTDPSVHRVFSLGECRALLERSGFEVEQAERFRIDPLWGLMRLRARRIGSDRI